MYIRGRFAKSAWWFAKNRLQRSLLGLERVSLIEMPAATETASVAENRAQVERILQSRVFRSSEVIRQLFEYLTEKSLRGESDSLKEYTIALDALGKPESFDPRHESVVRMHLVRLRQKLAEYYTTEGASEPIVVDIPKGGFKVRFEPRAVTFTPPPPPVEPVAEAQTRRWATRELIFAAVLAVTLTSTVLLATQFVHSRQTEVSASTEWTPALRELWEPLLSPNRRLVVCVATPLFVKVPGFGFLRESSVNDWDDVESSKRLNSMEDALRAGISEPSYGYTEVGTATAAFLLGQFLAPRKQAVQVTRANVLSWSEIAESNVIFLGSAAGIHQTDDLPVGLSLQLEPTGIRNLRPLKGEPAFIADRPAQNGAEGGESYTLISRLPAMNGPGAILMLAGNQTASVVSGVQAFTNPDIARMLASHLKTASGTIPKYFQVVLRVKAMDDVPVKIDYVFHRELTDRNTAAH